MPYTIISSQFQPFNYEQYAQPLTQATQAQTDTENQYAQMQQQSAAAHAYINPDTSPIAYKMYQDYNNQLQSSINDVYENGLNPSSQQQLMNARSQFNDNIIPIELAIQNKLKNITDYNNMVKTDPSLITSVNPANVSIDDYLKNPNLTTASVSGNQLTAKSSAMMQALAKSNRSVTYSPVLNGQYYERAVSEGYKPSDILAAVQGNAPAPVQTMINNLWKENNLDSYSPEARERAMKYILDGMYAGMQTTTSSPIANKAYDLSQQEQLAKYKAGLDINTFNYENGVQQQQKQAAVDAQGRLPMIPAYLVSPNLQGQKGNTFASNLSAFLGLNPLSNRFSNQVNVHVGTPGPQGGYDIKASLFNPQGVMLTRNQFISQAKNKDGRNALNSYYTTINSNIQRMGLQSPDSAAKQGRVWTAGNLSNHLRSTYSGNAPLGMHVYQMGDVNDAKSILGNIIAKGGDGDYLNNIQVVNSFDNKGNIKTTGEMVPKSTFLNKDKTVTGSPMFYLSPNPNMHGYIFTHEGKTYYVDANKSGVDMQQANQLSQGWQNNANLKNRLLKTYGAQKYYNSEVGQKIEDNIGNYASAYMRAMYTPQDFTFKKPESDILTNSEKQVP